MTCNFSKLIIPFLVLLGFLFPANGILDSDLYAQTFKSGPAGGGGGTPFSDDVPSNARVLEVRVWAGRLIDAIQIVYLTDSGDSIAGAKHGGRGGALQVFTLGRDEYITGVSGRTGRLVDRIQIHTNNRSSPLYGTSTGGNHFEFSAPRGNEVIGFFGAAGDLVDRIGAIMRRRRN